MDLNFARFTVQHLNISQFVAVVVTDTNGNSIAVQHPSTIYARKDGRFTIRAKDARNTRTVSLRGARISLVERGGKSSDYYL